MIHDPTDPNCNGCRVRVDSADPYLREWFWRAKSRDPSIHCSWGWRGQADQDGMVALGKSRELFPNSKHNFTIDGQPHSLALDIFQLISGKAIFNPTFCADLYAWSLAQGYQLTWGGTFKGLHDLDHFQLQKPSAGS